MTIDSPEVREFLARSMVIRLAALSRKGQPNIRCLWFVCLGGRIYIVTANANPSLRGISAHPEVALLFDGERGPRPSRLLRVRGRAVFRGGSRIVGRVTQALVRKYFLAQPGLRNLLAHARKVPLFVGFYAQGWRDTRGWRDETGKGLRVILEVVPESFEFLPRS